MALKINILSGIKTVNLIRDLGIILDAYLTFNQHVEEIINRSNQLLGLVQLVVRDFRDFRDVCKGCVLHNSPFSDRICAGFLVVWLIQCRHTRFFQWRLFQWQIGNIHRSTPKASWIEKKNSVTVV